FCDQTIPVHRTEDSLTTLPGGKVLERVLHHAAIATDDVRERELLVRISELEEDLLELQGVCDARQAVINELDSAARERLALVENLHRVAEERLSVINQLQKALEATSRENP